MVKSTLLLTLAGAAFGVAALTGCGSGGDGGNAGGGGPSTKNVADDKAELAFAKCMRESGIDVSDPDGSGRLQIHMRAPGGMGSGAAPQKLQDAMKACRKKTGGGPREPSEAEKTEMRDQALKFSRCMREHGVDMPDPEFEGGGGIKLTRKAGQRGLDPESPAFQKAQEACKDAMPMMRRGDGPSTTDSGGGGATGGDTGGAGVDVEVPKP